MTIGNRYQLIGKKRFVVLEKPEAQVRKELEISLKRNTLKNRIAGNINHKTGIFKLCYRASKKRGDIYENYCLLAEVSKETDETSKIEYAFVFDFWIWLYTKFLALLCILVPIISASVAHFKYHFKNPLAFIPFILVALFGAFSFFVFKEKQSDVKPLISEFEQLLVDTFDNEEPKYRPSDELYTTNEDEINE